jgi:hypothetical protein
MLRTKTHSVTLLMALNANSFWCSPGLAPAMQRWIDDEDNWCLVQWASIQRDSGVSALPWGAVL